MSWNISVIITNAYGLIFCCCEKTKLPDWGRNKIQLYMLISRNTPNTKEFTKFESEKVEEQTHKNAQTLMEMKWNQEK